MNFFCIKIAGVVIGIEHKYDFVKKMCREYIVDEKPEFTVCASADDIQFELDNAEFDSPADISESTAIYRKISEKMLDYNGFLFHSAVIEFSGGAYAFTARSGVGKSTHITLWKKHFGDRVTIINGDKPIFRVIDNEVIVYGTPWCGKESWQSNTSAPLKAICFLERGEKNEIETLNSLEVLRRIYSQLIMPKSKLNAEKMLDLLDVTVQRVPCYLLKCNISDNAVRTAFEGMVKQ